MGFWEKIPFPDDQLAVNYVNQIFGTRALRHHLKII
jgi:hypothetical protein